VNFAIITEPLRGITVAGIHISQCDGKVDEEKIEVIDAP
jgi:hypothetical protein